MLRRFFAWLLDATAQVILAAILGSAVITALISATVRQVITPSWEAAWVLWTTTMFGSYMLLIKTSPYWLPKSAQRRDGNDLYPTVEMLEAGRQTDRAKREALVREWRSMVMDVHRDLQRQATTHDGVTTTTAYLLEQQVAYLSFMPHISERTRNALYGTTFIVPPDQSSMNGALHSVLRDIDELERQWNLR